ncbi:hypothetical protein DFH08DRAFT_817253 [Mycena albidolilacea]|uniref:Uncharacterized protein n=1 Tax=Mycena albidolilacea TaxID=1033008 RepID=A0AAD6ZJ31_9AGAR|nr:hypothetical protein DFH08DRAFT_817253 [Mycena albidolilacea]
MPTSKTTRRIETPANVHGLGELAALLAKEHEPGQTFVEDLQRELQSLTENLEAASSQDLPEDFFNAAAHTASSFEKQSGSRPNQLIPRIEAPIMSGDVALTGDIENTLGFDSTRDIGHIGGEGDEDGTGGADGIGFETGGKGGTGKGPVIISAGRKRRS